MKAARFVGSRKVVIETVPTPVPGPGEVLLKVDYCGLCDLKGRNTRKATTSTKGTKSLPQSVKGDRASRLSPAESRHIPYTLLRQVRDVLSGPFHGMHQLCEQGQHRLGWPGGFAEYVVAPEQNLMYLDPKLTPTMGVLLWIHWALPSTGCEESTQSQLEAPTWAGAEQLALARSAC